VIARVWHGLIAVLVIVGLAIQAVIAVRAPGTPPAHAVGTLAGAQLAGRLLRTLSFFTIQSNILAAVSSAQLARRPDRDGAVWRIVRLDALLGITVTGIVYSTVLARIHEPAGWEQVSTNTVFHYVVPIMMVLGWLLLGPRPRIEWAVVKWALLWPVLWFGFTLVHGAVSHWYPYPFVDAASQGYARVLFNALLVTAVLGAVGLLYGLGDRALRRAPDPVAIRVA
jgi:uncharacterized membrane protein